MLLKFGQTLFTIVFKYTMKGFGSMIVRERKTPEQLIYYEVLLRRAKGVEAKVREHYYQIKAGLIGERRADREWKELNIPHALFHDFTLVNEFGHTHQIDTVFVCKHFILVVEVKNVAGRIDFDDQRRQFVRVREDGKVESFMNPVDQVIRHKGLLENAALEWTEHVPIEAAVIITNPTAVIGRVSAEVPIYNVTGLRTKIAELVKKHEHISFNMRTVRSYLEKMYTPLQREIWKLDIPIRNGVLCGNCREVMVHMGYRFACLKCGWKDTNWEALLEAMYDYRVLYKDEITNSVFREFVGVKSASTANKMLKKLFEKKNSTKGRVYKIPAMKRFDGKG